jgi:hypothetical protein
MATYARISLEFTSNANSNEQFFINLNQNGGLLQSLEETAVTSSPSTNQFLIGGTIEETANNCYLAFYNDYGSGKIIGMSNPTTVEIEIPFYDGYSFEFVGDGTSVNVTIIEEVVQITITNVNVVPSTTNPETDVRYEFFVSDTTYPFDAFFTLSETTNIKTINQASDQWLEYDRYPGTRQNIVVENTHSSDAASAPRVELFEITNININNQGTVEIISNIITDNQTYVDDITPNLEYSIDNINWQVSNLFSNVTSGNYIAYVRDEYDLVVQQDFIVDLIKLYVGNVAINKIYVGNTEINSLYIGSTNIF